MSGIGHVNLSDQAFAVDTINVVVEKAAAAAGSGLSPLWSSVLWTAAAAVVAAVLAAVLARSLKISEFRQAWINALREDSAELIGLLSDAHEAGNRASTEFAATGKVIWEKEYAPAIAKARALQSRIRLRINPNQNKNSEADKRFLHALDDLVNGCTDRANLCDDFPSRLTRFEMEARQLLKREWETTKQARS